MNTKRMTGALVTSMAAMATVAMMAGTAAAEGDGGPSEPTCQIAAYAATETVKEIPTDCEDDNGSWKPPTCDEVIFAATETKVELPEICGDDEGEYPVEPMQVWVPVPVIDYGSSLTVKGKGLCYGVPAIFAIQDGNDWTHRYFSPGQYVSEDGTAHYIFSAAELSGFYGTITVYVKQFGECEGAATTTATINKKPAPAPTPEPDNGTSRPTGNGGLIPDPAPAAPQVPTAVLSGGTNPTPAAAPVAPAVANAAASPAQGGASLPETGASTQLLQLALVAFGTGLGLMSVASIRRRSASTR